jgi:hypothetical protein
VKRWAVLWLSAIACGPTTAPPPALTETGWFTSTFDGDPDTCVDRLVSTVPGDGALDWYWRDRPQGYTATANAQAYDAWIETDAGARLPTTLVWDDSGLSFTVEWDGWLEASATYTLAAQDCTGVTLTTFTTSELGLPLAMRPESLIGRTYLLDLVGATWVEPSSLGALLALFFNAPILLGVVHADDVLIDVLAAQGEVATDGTVSQDIDQPSWDFPLADFSGAPFLDASAPAVSFEYSGVVVPVSDLELQGTFSADGTVFGGGVLSGLGDTREMGGLLNDPNNPSAMCDLAAGLAVQCQPCPDGLAYCLRLRAEDLEGTLVENLALIDVGG